MGVSVCSASAGLFQSWSVGFGVVSLLSINFDVYHFKYSIALKELKGFKHP